MLRGGFCFRLYLCILLSLGKKKKRKTDKHLFLGLPLIKLYCYRCSFLTSKRFECVFSLYNYSLFKKTKKKQKQKLLVSSVFNLADLPHKKHCFQKRGGKKKEEKLAVHLNQWFISSDLFISHEVLIFECAFL